MEAVSEGNLSGKAPSGVASAKSQRSKQSTTSNPRMLLGSDRTKFVKTVMESTFYPERTDSEAEEIGK